MRLHLVAALASVVIGLVLIFSDQSRTFTFDAGFCLCILGSLIVGYFHNLSLVFTVLTDILGFCFVIGSVAAAVMNLPTWSLLLALAGVMALALALPAWLNTARENSQV